MELKNDKRTHQKPELDYKNTMYGLFVILFVIIISAGFFVGFYGLYVWTH